MDRLVIYLSMKPKEGGKFQYSLSILNAFKTFDNKKYTNFVVYHDNIWEEYIPYNFSKVRLDNISLVYRIIRKIINPLPLSFYLRRLFGRYFDPVQKRLFKLKPDLVIYPGNDSLAYECNLPGVIPVFDLMHRYTTGFPEVNEESIYLTRESNYKNICKYAKAILVDSKVGLQHLIESYDIKKEKIYILPYIAPPYVRNTEKKVDVIYKYNLPEKYIFYPAQFWKHKNHEGILYAISLLRKQNIIVNAVFVGSDKNSGKKINELANELNLNKHIYSFNFVSNEDLIALYKKAVALVMPTFFGPTNIPQLEAFALGCPVITSNIYGIPEQVGDAALLVDPYSFSDIADKIKTLWNDDNKRQELIQKGYKKDLEWNQKLFNSKLLSIIERILNY